MTKAQLERRVAAWEMDKTKSFLPTWRVELVDTGDHYVVREFGMFMHEGPLASTRLAKGLKVGRRDRHLDERFVPLLPHDEAALMWANQVIKRTVRGAHLLVLASGPQVADTPDPFLMINFNAGGAV